MKWFPLILIIFLLSCNLLTVHPKEQAGQPAPVPTGPSEDTPSTIETSSSLVSPSPTSLTPVSIAGRCGERRPAYVTDFDVHQAPDIPESPARVPFLDPVFGTCLVRVTDRRTDLAPEDSSGGLKNEYSRVQSFNADGSRILAMGTAGTWYLYDAQTLQPLGELPLEVDPRWDAVNPSRIYYSSETRLMAYDLPTGQVRLVHDFAAVFPGQQLTAVWTRYEGSPSIDSRYWGLMAEDQDWLTTAFLVYDRDTDQVIAVRDLRGLPEVDREIDSVTISPLGNFFLAYFDDYCQPGELGSDENPCGLMVYDRELKKGSGLLRIVGHSDVALDAENREVLVYQDIDTDHIAVLDLATGTVTTLWPIDFSHTPIGLHFSGQAFRRPGWVLVSTHDSDRFSYTWMDDQVFALELKPGGRVLHLAHTHSLVDANMEQDYWAEPHASVNWDFTRILFTTNWGKSGTEQVEMYLGELPPDWSEGIGK